MDVITLKFGMYSLQFEKDQTGTYGYKVYKNGRCLYSKQKPIIIMLKDYAAKYPELYDAYTSVSAENDGSVTALGTAKTSEGTVFEVKDSFKALPDSAFYITRSVAVKKVRGGDIGFGSRFSIGMEGQPKMEDYYYLAPGAWYQHNQYAPDHFIGKNKELGRYWFRETRYALPFFSMQNRDTGETVSFSRAEADIKPIAIYDITNDAYTDASFNYGSLGMSTEGQMSIEYVYPGTEGNCPDMTHYRFQPYRYQFGFTRRMHPVKEGFKHSFNMVVRCSEEKNYYRMLKSEWRYFYNRFDPKIAKVDNKKLFDVTMELFDTLCQEYYGVYGVPFKCLLPSGEIGIVDYQFGFIGQQSNIAYLLLKYGNEFNKSELVYKAEKHIDFWCEKSLTNWGAPQTWYGVQPEEFLDMPIWLRMIGDGMEGVLNSYTYLKKRNKEKKNWLDFCRKVGDWLVSSADEDGAWSRAFNADGSVYFESKGNTTNVIRFLVMLYNETKKETYKKMALKAGDWSYENIYKKMWYVGGTCDNADVLDKESGIYAMFAFLSLYELTKEKKWLEALTGAADYTETWTYAWIFPVRPIEKIHALHHVDMSGQSLIATGHSGADVYMAACSYIYFKLYKITKDRHYLDFSDFLHHNPKQVTDLDGTFGYGRLGLCEESCGLWNIDCRGVYAWLPWCSYVQVEPIYQFLDAYGVYEVADAAKFVKMEE